jgi:TFIIF-interacting CTD phosphatase-like protein
MLVRPHLQEFLEAVRTRYELTLYTLGVASHAKTSLATIDPFNVYFRAVVSREALESDSKRLDFLVQDPRVVIIMDDNMQVTPHDSLSCSRSAHFLSLLLRVGSLFIPFVSAVLFH